MKQLSFNKHAFDYYTKEVKKFGFPVEKFNRKELTIILSKFVQLREKVSGYYTDDDRDKIVVNDLIAEVRNKKIQDLLS